MSPTSRGRFTRRPHVVTVTPVTRTRDAQGAPVWTPQPPVQVRGTMQPVSADEAYQLGLTSELVYRFLTPDTWPAGLRSRIEWDARDWQQIGEAVHHTTGRRTHHTVVRLKAKEAEPR